MKELLQGLRRHLVLLFAYKILVAFEIVSRKRFVAV